MEWLINIFIHKWQYILSGFAYKSDKLFTTAPMYGVAKTPLSPSFVSPHGKEGRERRCAYVFVHVCVEKVNVGTSLDSLVLGTVTIKVFLSKMSV